MMRCAGVVVVALFCFFVTVEDFGPAPTTIFLGLLVVVTILTLIGDRRRAIIFTERSVVYRPMFVTPHVVALSKITGLRRVKATFFPGGKSSTPAIAIDLATGEPEVWPMFFGAEVLERLSAVTGKKAIEG